jgi:hypothetical protein
LISDINIRKPAAMRFWNQKCSPDGSDVEWSLFVKQLYQETAHKDEFPEKYHWYKEYEKEDDEIVRASIYRAHGLETYRREKLTSQGWNYECLRQLFLSLYVVVNISEQKWIDFLGYFLEEDLGSNILEISRKFIENNHEWFDGYSPDPELLIRAHTKDVGAFLVRFSESSKKAFSITYRTENGSIEHIRINRSGKYFVPGYPGYEEKCTRSSLEDVIKCLIENKILITPYTSNNLKHLMSLKPESST